MKIRTLAAAAVLALPASTLLVACDRKTEDTSKQQSAQKSALEHDLDVALKPDSQPAQRPVLNDVPVTADSASPQAPAATPPPPPPAPKEQTPPPPRHTAPRPRQPRESAPPVAQAPSPAPAQPQYVTRTAAAGQTFTVSFDRQVSGKTDGVGSDFTATLTDALVDDQGRIVIPAGATVTGHITSVQRGRLGLSFTSVSSGGEHYPIDATVVTGPVTRQVNLDSKGERVAKVAAPAAAGAVLGRIIGHNRRGAVIGAVIGGAAGAAAAGATANVDTVVDPGATATIRLDGPVTIRRRASE